MISKYYDKVKFKEHINVNEEQIMTVYCELPNMLGVIVQWS